MTSRALPPRPAGARRASECARFVERAVTAHRNGRECPGLPFARHGQARPVRGQGEGGCGLVGSPLAGVMTSDRHQAEEHAGCADAPKETRWT